MLSNELVRDRETERDLETLLDRETLRDRGGAGVGLFGRDCPGTMLSVSRLSLSSPTLVPIDCWLVGSEVIVLSLSGNERTTKESEELLPEELGSGVVVACVADVAI